jgi:hypothetical protein
MNSNWFSKLRLARRPIRKNAEQLSRLALESLEDRSLPSGLPTNVFALFSGNLASGESHDHVRIRVLPENFTLPNDPVILGFELVAVPGSNLAPKAVVVREADGGNVTTILQQSGSVGGSSLTLAKLGMDEYDLTLDGVSQSRGRWGLRIFLAGDVNGDLSVNQSDINLLQGAIQGTVTLTSAQIQWLNL